MKKYSTCILLLFFSANIFSQVDLNLGLQAYYPFTGNANDISGNNNNPSFNNATLTADHLGNLNSAYSFNGVDNYMQIPSSASLNPGNQISLCAWVKPKGFFQGTCHGNMILCKSNDHSVGTYFLMYGDLLNPAHCSSPIVDETHQYFYGPSTFSNSAGYTPVAEKDKWYSVVYTYDGTKIRTYVNCEIKDSVVSSMNFSNSLDLFFGKINTSFNYWLNADLDEIRIYNRAINQDEVELYGECFTTPVVFKSFNSSVNSLNKIDLVWTVAEQSNIKNYSIERSIKNSADFVAIGNVSAKNTGINTSYSFTDMDVEPGVDYYYRISAVEFSGARKYSSVTTKSLRKTASFVSVYPNPSNGIFTLKLNDYEGMVDIRVVNSTGQIVLTKKTSLISNIATIPIDLGKMTKGIYWIKIRNGATTAVKKVVKR